MERRTEIAVVIIAAVVIAIDLILIAGHPTNSLTVFTPTTR